MARFSPVQRRYLPPIGAVRLFLTCALFGDPEAQSVTADKCDGLSFPRCTKDQRPFPALRTDQRPRQIVDPHTGDRLRRLPYHR